jgi:hypothetical protein
MLSKKDELYYKLRNANETEHGYIVRLLEEKTEYYKERVKLYQQELSNQMYRGDSLMVKQVKRYLKTFEDLLEYNQKLTDKVR